jgi:hypothetical protein
MIYEAITRAQSDHAGWIFLSGLTFGLSVGYAWAIRHARHLRRRTVKVKVSNNITSGGDINHDDQP